MNTTRSCLVAFLAATALLGCKKGDSGTNPVTQGTGGDASAYFPFVVGRTWSYNTSGTRPDGTLDPAKLHSYMVSVFQTNQLIGGQPNAIVLRTSDDKGGSGNTVVALDGESLMAYNGAGTTYAYTPNIYWYPYSYYIATVGLAVNQHQKYWITSDFMTSKNATLKRAPLSAIATASMVAPDTILITGVARGQTSFTLAGTSGVASDTLLVMVEVYNLTTGNGPAIPFPWIPVWKVNTSPLTVVLKAWDSTFAVNRPEGGFIHDHITYSITDQYLKTETVGAANMSISAEKHAIHITCTEAIDTSSGGPAISVFSGTTDDITANLWVAQGIGVVKADVGGVTMGSMWSVDMYDEYDYSGGRYVNFNSPRVSYFYDQYPPYFTYSSLRIITSPAVSQGTASFVLSQKNF